VLHRKDIPLIQIMEMSELNKFAKALPDAITCLIYLEYDGTVVMINEL